MRASPTVAAVLVLAFVGTGAAFAGTSFPSQAVAAVPTVVDTSIPEDTTTTTIDPFAPRPLPEGSGTGRRAVFSLSEQYVWVVDESGAVIRSFPVSGQRTQPRPGSYKVFSQSLNSFSPELKGVTFRFMTRFAIGRQGGNIGFHEIPKQFGRPMQTVEQLGTPLGSGCLRSSTADAVFMFRWAKTGTRIVVVD
jgi:hypothetical protein